MHHKINVSIQQWFVFRHVLARVWIAWKWRMAEWKSSAEARGDIKKTICQHIWGWASGCDGLNWRDTANFLWRRSEAGKSLLRVGNISALVQSKDHVTLCWGRKIFVESRKHFVIQCREQRPCNIACSALFTKRDWVIQTVQYSVKTCSSAGSRNSGGLVVICIRRKIVLTHLKKDHIIQVAP